MEEYRVWFVDGGKLMQSGSEAGLTKEADIGFPL